MSTFKKLINFTTEHPQYLFLIDSLGALITASSLGIILPNLTTFFYMPTLTLKLLAALACCLAIYSFCAYWWWHRQKWQVFMAAIATANTLYCVFTGILLVVYRQSLSIFDYIYFISEIIIIICLVYVEVKTIQKARE